MPSLERPRPLCSVRTMPSFRLGGVRTVEMWLCGMISVLVTTEINCSLEKVAAFILAKSALAKMIRREWSRACMQFVEG